MSDKIRSIAILMSLIGVIFVSGCASTGTILLHDSVTVKLSNFKNMMLDVTSQVSDSGQGVVQLESEIISRLRTKGLFERVFSRAAGDDAPHDLTVLVTIKEIRKVSPGARVTLGAFAGQGKMIVNIQLLDASSGSVVAQATAEGKTSGGTVFAGTTPQAVSKIADEVVKLIEQNM
ncbi:MAG: DUF4410 domain-containing protein [Kiritimatiellae bacterium]|nr:DUF4410 domain-containing protein [Kiritimatiellia bacterium]